MGRWLAGGALCAFVLSGALIVDLSGGGQPDAAPARAQPVAATHAKACPPEQRVGTALVSYAAYVRTRAAVYRQPGRARIATFGKQNLNGYPTLFGVLGAVAGKHCRAAWYRVALPMRPNGTVGYVRTRDVSVEAVRTRLVVDLSARRLTLYRSGLPVLHTTVAIGKQATPTPVGRYYVNQRLRPANPAGPYGPAAIGVSAFSNVLTGWAQGGPIGIHGTNEPSLIGGRVSNGCIRMTNGAITRLFPQVPAGTPVVIRA